MSKRKILFIVIILSVATIIALTGIFILRKNLSYIPTIRKTSPSPIQTVKYSCPKNGYVDCMPGPGEAKAECTDEALSWYKNNCPDFQGVAY